MSKIRASVWLLAAFGAAACSLNPQVEPPSSLTQMDGGASGSPVFSTGGQGGNGMNSGAGGLISGSGGASAGGLVGVGGASQGGYAGSLDKDASGSPDGAIVTEGGTDAGADGGTKTEGGTTKDARTD